MEYPEKQISKVIYLSNLSGNLMHDGFKLFKQELNNVCISFSRIVKYCIMY